VVRRKIPTPPPGIEPQNPDRTARSQAELSIHVYFKQLYL